MPALGGGEGPSPLSCHIPHHTVGTMGVYSMPRRLYGQKTHRLASRKKLSAATAVRSQDVAMMRLYVCARLCKHTQASWP